MLSTREPPRTPTQQRSGSGVDEKYHLLIFALLRLYQSIEMMIVHTITANRLNTITVSCCCHWNAYSVLSTNGFRWKCALVIHPLINLLRFGEKAMSTSYGKPARNSNPSENVVRAMQVFIRSYHNTTLRKQQYSVFVMKTLRLHTCRLSADNYSIVSPTDSQFNRFPLFLHCHTCSTLFGMPSVTEFVYYNASSRQVRTFSLGKPMICSQYATKLATNDPTSTEKCVTAQTC